ncbi:helix-turn-helix domain-containing protein [Dyadobacter subterraneus]|uniref:AraC family transcriptional regulator n=1 Tax=Dyadobacter subterraneus TaxID=2773304 RepID=A0ABR9WDU6_9BACT|nr:helix-turn-helix domain-containing protein [Dyadobacter subterraneus]MBE9463664.1 AraC family transcriptional regulator [Dyadobacter subterraneus]
MTLGQQLLFLISALGVFNGLVISAYLLLLKKDNPPASTFLGLLVFMLSIRICKAIFLYFNPELPRIYVQIGLSGCLLIGPSLFYFIKASLANVSHTAASWKYSYLFWVLLVAIGFCFPYASHPAFWKVYIPKLIYLQWAIFVILSGWLLRRQFSLLFYARGKLTIAEVSVLSIYGGALIVHIAFVLAAIGFFKTMYISGGLFFSLLLYLNILLFVNSKKHNTIFAGPLAGEKEKYGHKKIDSQKAMVLADKLHQLIVEQQLFKNPDLKIGDLAKKINIPAHQLSQLLNDNLKCSFSTYINEFRIIQACELIANDKGIKLEEIGYEVGFNSKSTFYTAFKKHKGATPAQFKEQLSTAGPI